MLGLLLVGAAAVLWLVDWLAARPSGGQAGRVANDAMLSLSGGLRRLRPAANNYTDSDGPLYRGALAPQPGPRPAELVVVSYNLHYGDGSAAARRAFAAGAATPLPDFILLQEANAADTETLATALGYDYVYFPASVERAGRDFGNAILSRWPLSDPTKLILPGTHPISGQQRTATRATARVDGLDVLLYSTHIEIATAPTALRVAQMATVAADVPAEAEAVIIGGDFNIVTPQGVRALVDLYAAEELDHASSGAGPTLTRFGVRVAADHLFVRGLEVVESGVLSDVTGSDHSPIWARLRWAAQNAS